MIIKEANSVQPTFFPSIRPSVPPPIVFHLILGRSRKQNK